MLCEPVSSVWEGIEKQVLILILMEYALWEISDDAEVKLTSSLNPYSNGICSVRDVPVQRPYHHSDVLILILMEYALWEERIQMLYSIPQGVLILILMEYALWAFDVHVNMITDSVLILILMEYALWDSRIWKYI